LRGSGRRTRTGSGGAASIAIVGTAASALGGGCIPGGSALAAGRNTTPALDGETHQLLRRDLQALNGSTVSFMPEGLEAGLSHQDVADLLAFLQSTGPAAQGAEE
jgi:hypothetical protein